MPIAPGRFGEYAAASDDGPDSDNPDNKDLDDLVYGKLDDKFRCPHAPCMPARLRCSHGWETAPEPWFKRFRGVLRAPPWT